MNKTIVKDTGTIPQLPIDLPSTDEEMLITGFPQGSAFRFALTWDWEKRSFVEWILDADSLLDAIYKIKCKWISRENKESEDNSHWTEYSTPNDPVPWRVILRCLTVTYDRQTLWLKLWRSHHQFHHWERKLQADLESKNRQEYWS